MTSGFTAWGKIATMNSQQLIIFMYTGYSGSYTHCTLLASMISGVIGSHHHSYIVTHDYTCTATCFIVIS